MCDVPVNKSNSDAWVEEYSWSDIGRAYFDGSESGDPRFTSRRGIRLSSPWHILRSRIRIEQAFDASLLRFDDVGYFNRVYAHNETVAGHLDQVETFYLDSPFGCELVAASGDQGPVADACSRRGWLRSRNYAWLHMKTDMAGGATMLGVMQAIAQLKPKLRVTAVVPATENMPSGKAYKPGDVITSMSGKTIEILNTDAEGRLVLADALTYAKQLGCTVLIDAATLTGAVTIALGNTTTGVFGWNKEWVERVLAAAATAGEKMWALPVDEDYRDLYKSSIAGECERAGSGSNREFGTGGVCGDQPGAGERIGHLV